MNKNELIKLGTHVMHALTLTETVGLVADENSRIDAEKIRDCFPKRFADRIHIVGDVDTMADAIRMDDFGFEMKLSSVTNRYFGDALNADKRFLSFRDHFSEEFSITSAKNLPGLYDAYWGLLLKRRYTYREVKKLVQVYEENAPVSESAVQLLIEKLGGVYAEYLRDDAEGELYVLHHLLQFAGREQDYHILRSAVKQGLEGTLRSMDAGLAEIWQALKSASLVPFVQPILDEMMVQNSVLETCSRGFRHNPKFTLTVLEMALHVTENRTNPSVTVITIYERAILHMSVCDVYAAVRGVNLLRAYCEEGAYEWWLDTLITDLDFAGEDAVYNENLYRALIGSFPTLSDLVKILGNTSNCLAEKVIQVALMDRMCVDNEVEEALELLQTMSDDTHVGVNALSAWARAVPAWKLKDAEETVRGLRISDEAKEQVLSVCRDQAERLSGSAYV